MTTNLTENRYSQLLSNNIPLRPIELVSTQREYSFLTTRAAELQSQLDLVNSQLDTYRILLSPWRRAPLEIIAEILSYAIPSFLTKRDMKAVVNFCLVSQRWYAAARHASRYWTYLHINLATTRPTPEGLTAWLSNSWHLPKTLSISTSRHKCTGRPQACQLANPALAKWFMEGPPLEELSIQLFGGDTECMTNFMEILGSLQKDPVKPRPWDQIERFKLKYLDVGFGIVGIKPFDGSFSKYLPPALTSLNLYLPPIHLWETRIVPDFELPIPPSLLEQLTSFEFGCDWDGYHMFKILQHCRSLETLTLDFDGRYSESDVSDADFELIEDIMETGLLLPNVHTLRLNYVSPTLQGLEILCLLRTPAIVDLEVNFQRFEDSNDERDRLGTQLPEFFQTQVKCGLAVKSLRIHQVFMGTEDELADLLSNFPSLTHLTLHNVIFNADNFLEIAKMGGLKHLQVLELLELPPSFKASRVRGFAKKRGIDLRITFASWVECPWTDDDDLEIDDDDLEIDE